MGTYWSAGAWHPYGGSGGGNEAGSTYSYPDAEWGYQAFTGAIQNDLRNKLVEVLAGKLTADQYTEEMNGLINEN